MTAQKHAYHDRIVQDRRIIAGKPVIEGTRIPVSLILNFLANGADNAEITADYPDLTDQDVQAAIAYALASLSEPYERAGDAADHLHPGRLPRILRASQGPRVTHDGCSGLGADQRTVGGSRCRPPVEGTGTETDEGDDHAV